MVGEHAQPGTGEGDPRGGRVGDEEVRQADAVGRERASSLDADTGVAEGLGQLGQRAAPVLEGDRQVSHARTSASSA